MFGQARVSQLAYRHFAWVPALVLLSNVFYAGIDVALWKTGGYHLTDLNGSTLRIVRNLSYCNFVDCLGPDSWKPMGQAILRLDGPDHDKLYEAVFFSEKTKFQYPPSSLLYYQFLDSVGLARIPILNRINLILFLANAALVLVCFTLALRKYDESARVSSLDWVLLTGASLVFYPTLSGLEVGQIQVWIDVMFSAACLLWLIERPALAGALIGAAITIKPQYAVFAVWALLWNQRRFLFGIAAILVPVLLLSLLFYGLHNHIEYLNVLSYISKHGEYFYRNQTINGLLNRFLYFDRDNTVFDLHEFAPYNGVVSLATFAAAIIFAIVALFPRPSGPARNAGILDFAVVATCATLSSPIAWEHHYGVFLPLLFIVLAKVHAMRTSPDYPFNLALLAVSWILVANDFAVLNVMKSGPLNIVQSYRFFGGLIFLLLLLHLRRQLSGDGASRAPAG